MGASYPPDAAPLKESNTRSPTWGLSRYSATVEVETPLYALNPAAAGRAAAGVMELAPAAFSRIARQSVTTTAPENVSGYVEVGVEPAEASQTYTVGPGPLKAL